MNGLVDRSAVKYAHVDNEVSVLLAPSTGDHRWNEKYRYPLQSPDMFYTGEIDIFSEISNLPKSDDVSSTASSTRVRNHLHRKIL